MSLEYIPLGEVADITKLAGFEFTKYIEYLEDGEIIALRALNLRNGTLDLSDIKYISKEVSESLPRSKLYKNDILLTYTGNGYGDCAIVKENDKYHLAPNIAKITPKKINPYFLFEYINSKYFKKQMKNYIGGSSQPTIPMKTLRILEVPLPDINTQNKVAKILSNINEKIEVNKRINKNLETQRHLIFKFWFIDFGSYQYNNFSDSVFGLIPNDWKIYDFKEILTKRTEKSNDYSIPLFSVTNTGIHPREDKFNKNLSSSSSKFKLIYKNDLVFGMSREILNWGLMDENIGGVSSAYHVFKIDNEKVNPFYLKSFIENYMNYFKDIIKPASREGQGIDPNILFIKQIYVPPEHIFKKFYQIDIAFENLIKNNQKEINYLTNLRNILLPELMSGKIDVSHINLKLDNLSRG